MFEERNKQEEITRRREARIYTVGSKVFILKCIQLLLSVPVAARSKA